MKKIKKFYEIYKKYGVLEAFKILVSYCFFPTTNIKDFAFNKSLDVKKDIQTKYNFSGDLLNFFVETEAANKWHHYIPLYDKYFSSFRGRKIKILEIGVSKGGGIKMWRKYFGDKAIIFGIDINPECATIDLPESQIRIGSQTDEKFLDSVIKEMGGDVDIILDDGSHRMDHIQKSLKILFPKLNERGIYVIEDLHTAYFSDFFGGYKSKLNFFNLVRDLIDDMHIHYHKKLSKEPLISEMCSGIHVHDSIVFLEKAKIYKPTFSKIVS